MALYITFLNLFDNKLITKFIKNFFYDFIIIKNELNSLYDRYRDNFIR